MKPLQCAAQVACHHALPNTLEEATQLFLGPRLVAGFGFVLTADTYLLYKYNLSIYQDKIKVCPITSYQNKSTLLKVLWFFVVVVVTAKQQRDVIYLTCL